MDSEPSRATQMDDQEKGQTKEGEDESLAGSRIKEKATPPR